jgi:hypothetical protein
MLLFWVDESAEVTADEDAAVARTATVEVRPFWDAPWDH